MNRTYSIFRGGEFLGLSCVPEGVEPTVADGCTAVEGDHTPPPRAPDEAERLRNLRSHLLADSDWVISRAYEQGVPVPPAWVAYRQALRDLPTLPGWPDVAIPQPPVN